MKKKYELVQVIFIEKLECTEKWVSSGFFDILYFLKLFYKFQLFFWDDHVIHKVVMRVFYEFYNVKKLS